METRGGKTGRHDENSGDGMPRFKTNSRLELAANGFSIADIFNWIASSPLIHLIWKSIWQLNPRGGPIWVMSSSFSKKSSPRSSLSQGMAVEMVEWIILILYIIF